MKSVKLAAVLCAAVVCSVSANARSDTSFTYQGDLDKAGAPASGSFNVVFSLYDALSGGSQVGPTVTVPALPVDVGLFTVELDFGALDYSGAQYWLEIEVDGDTLSPRQPLTASPYSIQTRGMFVDDVGNAGVGTTSPQVPMHIVGRSGEGLPPIVPGTMLLVQQNDIDNWAHIGILSGRFGRAQLNFGDADNDRQGAFSYNNVTDSLDVLVNAETRMTINGLGNVGIGTSNPLFPLHVETDGDSSIYANNSDNSSLTYGVYGRSESYGGVGVYGEASADAVGTATHSYGGRFVSRSAVGRGVHGSASSSTGENYGVLGTSVSTSGRGVYGKTTAATGITYGVYGENESVQGSAVYGNATATTGFTYGGRFINESTDGRSVYGWSKAATGNTYGAWFQNQSTSGVGVFGFADASTGTTSGGRFLNHSTSGYGVYGEAHAETGTTYGGRFDSHSSSGRGVYGYAFATSGLTDGVFGRSNSTSGRGICGWAPATSGVTYGVVGQSDSSSGTGVFGEATRTTGITYGGRFEADSTVGRGIFGFATANSGVNYGVVGHSNSSSGYDFWASGAGTNYGSPSSRRWKNNVEPIADPLYKLAQIRGVYFDWDQEHGGQHDVGMIAEEVGKVLPEIVQYEENGVDAIGMDYSKVTPLLVEATNALRAEKDKQIQELRYENQLLNARLDRLEQMMTLGVDN